MKKQSLDYLFGAGVVCLLTVLMSHVALASEPILISFEDADGTHFEASHLSGGGSWMIGTKYSAVGYHFESRAVLGDARLNPDFGPANHVADDGTLLYIDRLLRYDGITQDWVTTFLGKPAGNWRAFSNTISGTGRVVAGAVAECGQDFCPNSFPVVWQAPLYEYLPLATFPGDTGSIVHGISQQGDYLVGLSYPPYEPDPGPRPARVPLRVVRWASESGRIEEIAYLPEGNYGIKVAISGDGTSIAMTGCIDGMSGLAECLIESERNRNSEQRHPTWLWNQSPTGTGGTFIELPTMVGIITVANQGDAVFGTRPIFTSDEGNASDYEAALWMEGEGLRSVNEMLRQAGVPAGQAWDLESSVGMSPDGRVLVGNGTHIENGPSGWMVVFELPGDTNGDQTVDLNDLNNVRNNFGGAGAGDTNNDGVVDLIDLNNVRNFFGTSAPQAVPEPSSFVLISAMLVCALSFIPHPARSRRSRVQ